MGAGGEPLAELSALVEEGYRLFKAPPPANHGCCVNCCMYPEVEERLLKWPVREIPLHDLKDWYFAASDNPFPAPTMKWILPRVLDFLAQGEGIASVGTEVVLQRLKASGFPQDWPEYAGDFMARYATALLAAVATAPDAFKDGPYNPFSLDELLCMFGTGGVDLRPALTRLDALPTGRLAAAMASDWVLMGPDIWVNAFWESGPAKDLVFGWLASDPMLERMLAYGAEGTGQDRDNALSFAEAILRWREAMDGDGVG